MDSSERDKMKHTMTFPRKFVAIDILDTIYGPFLARYRHWMCEYRRSFVISPPSC